MRKKILIGVFVVLVLVVGFVITTKVMEYQEKFELDSTNKYIVITNASIISMQSDGGSHTNVYYEIDLDANKIAKKQDKYVGFKGYEYKNKTMVKVVLTESQTSELKSRLELLIEQKTERPEEINFDYCFISTIKHKNIKVYDTNIINEIEELL